jgi:hypothetical protein
MIKESSYRLRTEPERSVPSLANALIACSALLLFRGTP